MAALMWATFSKHKTDVEVAFIHGLTETLKSMCYLHVSLSDCCYQMDFFQRGGEVVNASCEAVMKCVWLFITFSGRDLMS